MELQEGAPPPEGKGAVLETPFGLVHLTLEGAPRPGRPALLTLPDVGHTHASCYAPLFAHPEMREVASRFLLVHLDPPGMEEGAPPYPPGYQYPSLDQLAEIIPCVLQYLNIASIVGIGVGAGAFVLAKFGLLHPEAVEGLVLINIDPHAKGWVDWAVHKLSGLTSPTNELILAHLFTQEELAAAPPPVRQGRERLGAAPNAPLLWAMYNSRGNLGLQRSGANSLRCPVLLVVGDNSPHEDAVVECNAKLDPTQTSFLKMADGGGQPQITQPAKLTEAFKYFLQGMGYLAAATMTRLSRSRTASLSSTASGDGGRGRSLSRGSLGGGGGGGRGAPCPLRDPRPPPRNPPGDPPRTALRPPKSQDPHPLWPPPPKIPHPGPPDP